ncbi:MAG: hypothetical protein ACT4QC_10885 [Planctomycetaceae bacterium]
MNSESGCLETLPPGLKRLGASANHYDLLGLRPFESDAAAISTALRDCMREVRKYQIGRFAPMAGACLERLSAASACLLDGPQKAVYDEALRRQFDLPPVAVAATYVPQERPAPAPRGAKRPRRNSAAGWTAVVVCTALVAIVLRWQGSGATDRVAPSSTAKMPRTETGGSRGGAGGGPGAGPRVARSPAAQLPSGARAVSDPRRPDRKFVAANGLAPQPLVSPAGKHAGQSSVPASPGPAWNDASGKRSPASPGDTAEWSEESAEMRSHTQIDEAHAGFDHPQPRGGATDEPLGRSRSGENRPRAESAAPASKPSGTSLALTRAEVLRELKAFRMNSGRIGGVKRIRELVQYGRSEFADDARFQNQLHQEIGALQRAVPHLRGALPPPPRRP